MRRKKALVTAIDLILIAILVISNTTFILVSISLFARSLGWNHSFRMTIGYSMYPAIKHGDTRLVEHEAREIKVGDIICFRVGSVPIGICHRVINVEESSEPIYHTKGDANEHPDEYGITNDQVTGKVILVIPTSLFLSFYTLLPSIVISVTLILIRMVYCYLRRDTTDKKFQDPVFNQTTVLLLLVFANALGKACDVLAISSLYNREPF